MWVSHGATKEAFPKQSLLAFPQSWYSWVFFLPWWPLPPNQAHDPWSHPWFLLLSQLMIESSYCSLVLYSFLFISLPLSLFWQKALNLFCLHKGTWLRGQAKAGIEITPNPQILYLAQLCPFTGSSFSNPNKVASTREQARVYLSLIYLTLCGHDAI